MGVVSVSSSAARTPLGLSAKLSARLSQPRRPGALSFKTGKTKNATLVVPQESHPLPMETSKENEKRVKRAGRRPKRVEAVSVDQATPSTLELDYNEAAAKLEHIYKRSPASSECETELLKEREGKRGRQRKAVEETNVEANKGTTYTVVRSGRRKSKRLSLDKRIALRKKKDIEALTLSQRKKLTEHDEDEKIDRLVREYSASTDFGSLDWKKMKIPSVLSSTEHAWLFKLMQPLKVSMTLVKYF